MRKIIVLIVAAFTLAGCGAGLRPGCKVATPDGYCKYQMP